MKIQTITVTAEASKAYQKYCVALTAEEIEANDINTLKTLAIQKALEGIDELAGGIGEKPVVKTEVKQHTPVNNYYTQPARKVVSDPSVKMCSEKQAAYLKSLGFTGDTSRMTFADADRELKILKGEL